MSSYLTKYPNRDIAVRALFEDDIPRLEESLEIETAGEQAQADQTGANGLPSRYLQMLNRMRDPVLGIAAGVSITRIMRDCGLKATEIMDVIRKRDIALAILNSGRHIYQVLDDMGEDAKSRIVTCKQCGGEGKVAGKGSPLGEPDEGEEEIPDLEICGDCDGAGKLRKIGDAGARNLLFEVHGLKKSAKGGNTNVNVGVGVGVSVKGDKAEGQQEAITSKVGKILDAEVISR